MGLLAPREHVQTGLRVALGIAWVVLVPAEMLGVRSGLGYQILNARDQLAYGQVVAAARPGLTAGYSPHTERKLSSRRTSSAWRCVPVLSKTCWRWVLTVASDNEHCSAMNLSPWPCNTSTAISASPRVKP